MVDRCKGGYEAKSSGLYHERFNILRKREDIMWNKEAQGDIGDANCRVISKQIQQKRQRAEQFC